MTADFLMVQTVVVILLMVGPMCVVATIVMVGRSASAAGRWRRARPPGTCRRCGYDLRATPDRCPECGRVVERDRRTIGPDARAPDDRASGFSR